MLIFRKVVWYRHDLRWRAARKMGTSVLIGNSEDQVSSERNYTLNDPTNQAEVLKLIVIAHGLSRILLSTPGNLQCVNCCAKKSDVVCRAEGKVVVQALCSFV